MWGIIKRNWFILGLLLAVLLGWLIRDLYTGKDAFWLGGRNFAIVEIFFISGLTIASRQLAKTTLQWRTHTFIQGLSLGVFPLVIWALQPLWRLMFPEELVIGLLVLGALPTTIISCVALTRIAQGDDAVALVNATLGNLLGIFVTPALLLLMLGTTGEVQAMDVLKQLFFMVALPMAAGQLVRYALWRPGPRANKLLRYPVHIGILFILMVVMMKSFVTEISLNPWHLVLLLITSVVLHAISLVVVWYASAWPPLQLTPESRSAALFCISQKTLALGAPLIAIAFAAHPGVGLIVLPILIYHPIQLLMDATIASRLGEKATSETLPN